MAVFERATPIAIARCLRKASVPTERLLWGLLRNRQLGGFKFRRQVPIGRFIVDFACLRHRLAIEIDGATHVDPEHDRQRERWLIHRGYRVLRFRNSDVWKRSRWVLNTILDEALRISGPSRGARP